MIKNGKYRFSLQFGSDTEDQIRAGNLLERLGNKKSVIVVNALNNYLKDHPELLDEGREVRVTVSPVIGHERLEQLIRSIIEEKMTSFGNAGPERREAVSRQTEALEEDVAQMLENLDLFQ